VEHKREICLMEEQEGAEMFIEFDKGEMLVIRRALNVQRSTKDEQRENIFFIAGVLYRARFA